MSAVCSRALTEAISNHSFHSFEVIKLRGKKAMRFEEGCRLLQTGYS